MIWYNQSFFAAMLLCAGLALNPHTVIAKSTVELVVSTTPGGSQDIATRELQKALESVDPSRNYVVTYKPGAAGLIAYNYALQNRTPTLVMLSAGAVTEVALTRSLVDIQREVNLMGPIWTSPGVLAVGADSGINSLEDLVKKGRQGRVTCGASGKSIKLALDYFVQNTGMIDPAVVLYKGTQEGMPGLISGDIDCWLDGLNGPMDSLSKAGRIKIIASSENRAPDILSRLPIMKTKLKNKNINWYYQWFLTVGIPQNMDPEFKKDIVPILHQAIRTLPSTETIQVQQPEQYDTRFFVRHVEFVSTLVKEIKTQ